MIIIHLQRHSGMLPMILNYSQGRCIILRHIFILFAWFACLCKCLKFLTITSIAVNNNGRPVFCIHICMHTLSISFSRFNYHGNWFNNGLSRWPVPSSPLLNPTSYPQSSPLLSPKWPPLSPLLSPYQGDFTQGNHQEPPF